MGRQSGNKTPLFLRNTVERDNVSRGSFAAILNELERGGFCSGNAVTTVDPVGGAPESGPICVRIEPKRMSHEDP
jgi:hypothetical protein